MGSDFRAERNVMIISASRKTDIPAFYGEWFMHRLDAGYALYKTQWGTFKAGLKPEDVDGFVFWTKAIGPFMQELGEIKQRGYAFYVHHTINNYPSALEPCVPAASKSVENMRELARQFGPDAAVWRYDPVIINQKLTWDWHFANFAQLAEALSGTTNEVIISFVDDYKKMSRNMALAGVPWVSLGSEQQKKVAQALCVIARDNRMQLTLCCESQAMPAAAKVSRCIDAERMSRVAGKPLGARPHPCRAGCGCCDNRDIGSFDTCLHGCVYCYATSSLTTAQKRFSEHNPFSESL
jgi:hypothetical protein